MAVKILSKQSRVGILKQAAWATPQAASANFRTLYYNAGSINPNPDVQIDQYNTTSQNGIHTEYERRFIDSLSGLPSISFSGVADKNTIAPHLVAALQAVTEGASSPYVKTISCGGLTSPIDFAGDGGFLHTVAFDINASADDGVLLKNAIINNLNLSFDFNNRGIARLGQISGTWVGNEMNFEQTLSGTWVTTTLAPYNNTDTFSASTLTIDSVVYAAECLRKFELIINNNVTSNCKTTGGKANQYDITPDYRATIVLDYNATTEKILKDYTSGARVQMVFKNDINDDTDGALWITGSYGVLQSNPYIYNGDFIGIGLDIKFYSNAAATPLSVIVVDTLDWSY